MSGSRILLVDDDPAILRAVQRSLEEHGYAVTALAEGGPVAACVAREHPDVLLLDLVLPDVSGVEVCRRVRAMSNVPIIILSAIGDDARKVEALDEGADDYLTKPFSLPELQARIRAALRRGAAQPATQLLSCGPIVLDRDTRAVTVGDEPIHLTRREFEVLRLLLQHQGRVLTQRQLLSEVWGPEYVDDSHILRTFVYQLRTKLGPVAGRLITTDPGVGYRINTASEAPSGR